MATNFIVINGGIPGQADVNISLNAVVSLTSSVSAATYEWVIVSQPEGAPQVNLDPYEITNPIVSTSPTCSLIPTKEGSYLIRLTLNAGEPDESVATTICAVRELQTGNRIPAPQETTEVNSDEGWAPGAVTKILQRVTRLSDSGIFVAQNDSGGALVPGNVVHMNGMALLGVGDNERYVPTVGKALATDLALVDGPLGVMVGNAAEDPGYISVADGGLCRVMVMGGLPAYAGAGTGGTAGDPIYVSNTGTLSLTAGDFVRQVGDVAKVISDGVYEIAISAGANSIPRGNAAGDLDGMYPDPTVVAIQGNAVAAPATPGHLAYYDGVTTGIKWGPVDLSYSDSVTGTLPAVKGGTGNALYPSAGGIVYGTADSKLDITGPGTAGYLLQSNGAGIPSWLQTVPVNNGGTNANSFTGNRLVATNAAGTALSSFDAGTSGYLLKSNGAGSAPSWIQTVPVTAGGTGSSLSTPIPQYGVVYASTTSAMSVTSAGSLPQALISGAGSGPPQFGALNLSNNTTTSGLLLVDRGGTGKNLYNQAQGGIVYIETDTNLSSGSSPSNFGQLLVSVNPGSGNYAPGWLLGQGSVGHVLRSAGAGAAPSFGQIQSTAFAQASIPYSALISVSSSQTVTGTYTNTTTSYTPMAQVVRALSIGAAYFDIMPQEDGTEFYNRVTTAANNTSANVYIKATITNTSGFSETYVQRFAMPTAHNNNQITGSITFPHWQFFAPINSTYTVTVWAAVGTAGDSFQASEYRLVVSQG